jgi:hypothetical protein
VEDKPKGEKEVEAPVKLARINHNSIINPFGGDVCDTCHNDKSKICKECGCQKCHKKTGNPLVKTTKKKNTITGKISRYDILILIYLVRFVINVSHIGIVHVLVWIVYLQRNFGTALIVRIGRPPLLSVKESHWLQTQNESISIIQILTLKQLLVNIDIERKKST